MISVSLSINCLLILLILLLIEAEDDPNALFYEIKEEIKLGSVIADVKYDAKLSRKYDTNTLNDLQFRFLAQPDVGFSIEQNSGILLAGGQIDRDYHCPGKDTCIFRLDIVAIIPDPLKFIEIIKVNVKVEDINDNYPVFPENYISHPILESALVGSSFVVPTASDPDSNEFSIQNYELMSESDKFALEIKDKLDGSQELELVLMESLDREKEDSYNIKVIALDGGSPPKTGTIDVTVTVIDTNDHYPIFKNSSYVITIDENITPMTTIIKVQASDADTGLYGKIHYDFSTSTKASYGRYFGINNETGDIFNKVVLDYEKAHVYPLTITAHDKGPDSLGSDTSVTVHLRDLNDNSPLISVNTLAASGTNLAEIAEDAPNSTFVAHITVSDPDSGDNGKFSCALSDNHFRLEKLYSQEYQIITTTVLDREARSLYNLALTCQDFGKIPQISIKNIEVAVIDVNDNAPIFRQPSYIANLMENNKLGTFLTQVNASDKDVGKNGEVKYSMDSSMRKMFHINANTGILTAQSSFDHETESEYTLKVYATDQGSPPLNSSAIVVVYIHDVNDVTPKFSQSSYSFGVNENEKPHTEVGIVKAIDLDDPPNNIIEYTLLKHSDHQFDIGYMDGRIKSLVSLDREKEAVHHLEVQAKDRGSPPLISVVKVTVYVDDENDNPPVISFPTRANNTVQISNKVPIDQTFTRVMATDKDIGKNANLSYWFSEGNRMGYFSINSLTGSIRVKRDLSRIVREHQTLEILVQDQGSPQKNVFTDLHIIINDSIPYYAQASTFLVVGNFTIVIVVACVSGVIAVILIICIVCVFRSHKRNVERHKCLEQVNVFNSIDTNEEKESSLNTIKAFKSEYEKPKNLQYFNKNDARKFSNNCNNKYLDPSHNINPVVQDIALHDIKESNLKNVPEDKSDHCNYHNNDVHDHEAIEDNISYSSAEGSNADSGRGPSEEGENNLKVNGDSKTLSENKNNPKFYCNSFRTNHKSPVENKHNDIGKHSTTTCDPVAPSIGSPLKPFAKSIATNNNNNLSKPSCQNSKNVTFAKSPELSNSSRLDPKHVNRTRSPSPRNIPDNHGKSLNNRSKYSNYPSFHNSENNDYISPSKPSQSSIPTSKTYDFNERLQDNNMRSFVDPRQNPKYKRQGNPSYDSNYNSLPRNINNLNSSTNIMLPYNKRDNSEWIRDPSHPIRMHLSGSGEISNDVVV